jgi:two-component system nitrogen regulation sensor histidine kinase NtrY
MSDAAPFLSESDMQRDAPDLAVQVAARTARLAGWLEYIAPLFLLCAALGSYAYLSSQAGDSEILSPPLAAAILLLNLVPAIVVLILIGRRIAANRAKRTAIGGNGGLHVRLVEQFSLITAIPMLLVVIFASLLFQYGVEFWFSDRSRGMLENASDLARGYYEQNQREVGEETVTMAVDLRNYLAQAGLESPEFAEGYAFQVLSRKLNESAIIEIGPDGMARTAALVDPDSDSKDQRITAQTVARLKNGQNFVVIARPDKIEAVTALDLGRSIFLYAARDSDMLSLSQWERAQQVLRDYDQLFEQSRRLQLQFNIALFFGALIIIAFSLWIALIIADRLVRPVSELVQAARRVSEGDLSSRVTQADDYDEVGILGGAFNRMTERLESQTRALIGANAQLQSRREFIETVLESVSSGIINVDENGIVRLVNTQALKLLNASTDRSMGQNITELAPEIAQLIDGKERLEIITLARGREQRTLAVRLSMREAGYVITFEDITQQLLDQRRAAWSDVARRIAHEIKNPLTPIQLAAERLKRRFGHQVDADPIFGQLTDTIVRQVGDLRNIVDEFSSFARMPKPMFREENLIDLVKQSVFLQEVANPQIAFRFAANCETLMLRCDRRQLGQAMTNILKNAVEAIQQTDGDDAVHGAIATQVTLAGGAVQIEISDNGIGLPPDRERIVEPYMTTREQGTGLGLAIVTKIVEEHFGEIAFADAPGGGTIVFIRLYRDRLAAGDAHSTPLTAVPLANTGETDGT